MYQGGLVMSWGSSGATIGGSWRAVWVSSSSFDAVDVEKEEAPTRTYSTHERSVELQRQRSGSEAKDKTASAGLKLEVVRL